MLNDALQLVNIIWVFVVIIIVYLISSSIKQRRLSTLLLAAVKIRLDDREKGINEIRDHLPSDIDGIRDRARIVDELQSGKISAVQVLQAFQEKALLAHTSTNCIQQFIVEARECALELDVQSTSGNYRKPPLFGIPFSVKDIIPVKHYESPWGCAIKLSSNNSCDSTAVEVLRKLGAIPFCITNMPQTGLSFGSSNPIYGLTVNPLDLLRGPGGSSSGEGSLIGFGGSILGLGTDVGGSIRVPAHFCGICALKPSSMRVSQKRMNVGICGRIYPKGTWGPMTRDVDSLVTVMRHVYDDVMFDADDMVPQLKFDEALFTSVKKLTIGFYFDDGYMPAVPACERAVMIAKNTLEKNGHQLIKFDLPKPNDIMSLAIGIQMIDGGKLFGSLVDSDLHDPFHYKYSSLRMFGINPFVRRLLAKFALPWWNPRLARALSAIPSSNVQVRELFEQIDIYLTEFGNYWKRLKLDALICPAHPCTPLRFDVPSSLIISSSYSVLYNMLDFTAGVIPVTTVTDEDDDALEGYPSDDELTRLIKEGCQGGQGLPVGVQVVTPPFKDERCLRLMKELDM